MKRSNYLLWALLVLFLGACGMKHVSMNSMVPASITLPPHIKTIVLVDRTEHEKTGLGTLEGVLTGEGIGEDQNGVQEAISSLQNGLMSSPRYQVIRASEVLKGNSMLGATFPEPITWNQINILCSKYKADAVIALELFDTNFIVTDGKRSVKKEVEENGVKKTIDAIEYYAEGVATAKIGFRLYDPKNKNIADQQTFSRTNTWEAKANSVKDALAALIQKSEATRYLSGLAGNSYAHKIAPMPVRISREFYGKPRKNQYMQAGVRQSEVGQWEEAIVSWRRGMLTADAKTAGRLAYNVAVGFEVLGDYAQAKAWAGKSYINYGNKKARSYNAMLEQRMLQEDIVNEQMRIEEDPLPDTSTGGGQPMLKPKKKN
ncbi:DUF6340 family protein [Cytophagales bacterium LB-30]|uniref:DUF6340 family protein n=1 Tax=Shiella aurantiaca TaxID=3058365 RepID=A0ABT8F2P8_9BACT|nr:DUF6340 family protein [Shiella aurantiaca]MDN4164516.1 DUF6340 family protein [Shiella aurantiaca]